MNTTAPLEIDPVGQAASILALIARSRGNLYRWLALGFYPPDEELAAALSSGRMAAELGRDIAWLGADQELLLPSLAGLEACPSCSLAGLAEDYARLFGKGVGRVSLREATYRWRDAAQLMQGQGGLTLEQAYSRFGVTAPGGEEDHAAVELEFLLYLCEREAEAWSVRATKTARELRRQERNFLDDHLGRWLPEMCWRVTQRSGNSFYGPLALLAQAWLSLDQGPGYAWGFQGLE